MSRQRYDGNADQLHAILEPFVVSASWLHYVEKVNLAVKPSILIAHKALFQQLTSLCPNLAFTQAVVTEVFKRLLREKAFPSLAATVDADDWVETMTKRFRCACRHIARNRCRKPPPKWLQHLDGMGAASSGPGEGQAGEDAGSSAGQQEPRR